MAEKNEESMDTLRNELNTLRDQMETLVKSLGEKGGEASSDMVAKLERNWNTTGEWRPIKCTRLTRPGAPASSRWANRCAGIP